MELGKHEVFCVDAALIYESGADTHMDYTIVVTSHLKLRIERVMKSGVLTREEFMKILEKGLMPVSKYLGWRPYFPFSEFNGLCKNPDHSQVWGKLKQIQIRQYLNQPLSLFLIYIAV